MNFWFEKKSKYLLLQFLKEPGGFSFFPSSFFWKSWLDGIGLEQVYTRYFLQKNIQKRFAWELINLYIHIPFCTRICSYCNCFKNLLQLQNEVDMYIEYLEKEAKILYLMAGSKKILIESIFIGWWTPNILSVSQLKKLYWVICMYFDITHISGFIMDGHPNYYDEQKIKLLFEIWVTRVTFAVQTFEKWVLQKNNRDSYNIDALRKNIEYCKQYNIHVNIDLLIWMQWQTFEWVQADYEIIESFQIDNLSIHYLMQSNNIEYNLDDWYDDLVIQVKNFFKSKKIPSSSPHIQESHYASKRSSTLTLWSHAVSSIYENIIYKKPGKEEYYNQIDSWFLPFEKGMLLSKRDEMVKYIYLNILYGVNRQYFYELFSGSIESYFSWELSFLLKNNIIQYQWEYIKALASDYKTLIYCGIFFIKKFSNFRFDGYTLNDMQNNDIQKFFSKEWDLIDK